MGMDGVVHDLLGVVLKRFAFVDYLGDDPKDKRTLVEDLDCSRSTVDRGIRELEALDLVEYVAGGYRLTSLGDAITSDFRDLTENVERRLRFQPFLKWMPADAFDLELEHLADADLLVPEQGNPYAAIDRHVRRLETLEDGKFLLPFVGMHASEKAYDRVVHHGAECEIVVAPAVWDTFRSDPNFTRVMDEMLDTGRMEVFVYEDEMPFSLAVFTDVVQITVDENEEPRALVETDTAEVREWAEATFEAYKQQAEPVITSQASTTIQG